MYQQIKDRIGVALAKHNLTVESVFVPFSLSRNAGEKSPSLNWKVTLKHNGRKVLTTDYSAGCGHAPSYNQRDFKTVDGHNAVLNECETGRAHVDNSTFKHKGAPILPDARDAIYSLLIDSDVLNHGSYEDWAAEFGYDEDSRAGEKVYNECMKIALQFRKIGESVIEELREAYQDY